MEFFDSLIKDTRELLSHKAKKELDYSQADAWRDEGYSSIILQRDCAYELKGTGFNLVTSSAVEDKILLYGDDLNEIKGDCSYARICLVSVEADADGQKAYELIKKIEYVKYHCFPEGYMMRSASGTNKEAIRVSKNAISKGISFQKIGNLLIKKYKELPEVKSVTVVFVTDKNSDFTALAEIGAKSNGITKALNSIMENLMVDCDSCSLKPICDEVEGMRELHFSKIRG